MDMYNPNYRSEKFENDKSKFESLDLKNVIKEIYFTAISKAQNDYQNEIEENKNRFLDTSYNEEQAVQKLNYYIDEIRVKNEDDDCDYRFIKDDFIKENPNAKREEVQKAIIEILTIYINSEEIHYTDKLNYIEELPQQIYESNKIHNQFLFFKKFIEEHNNKKISNANRTDIAYYCYYTSQTKTLEIDNVFPSSKAWDEIGKKFNKNPKNIQTIYNLIVSNEAERFKKTKIKNIEFVIENLLNNIPEALKLAKSELNIAYLNS